MIQKWLGIKTEDELHREIREIADKIVNSEPIFKFVIDRVVTNLHWRDIDSIRAIATESVNKTINGSINNEKFIDDIVQRIKNKQL